MSTRRGNRGRWERAGCALWLLAAALLAVGGTKVTFWASCMPQNPGAIYTFCHTLAREVWQRVTTGAGEKTPGAGKKRLARVTCAKKDVGGRWEYGLISILVRVKNAWRSMLTPTCATGEAARNG